MKAKVSYESGTVGSVWEVEVTSDMPFLKWCELVGQISTNSNGEGILIINPDAAIPLRRIIQIVKVED